MTIARLPMTEADLLRAVLDIAQLFGWLPYRTWLSIHSPAGFPDLVLMRPPRLVFAELKRESGKVSDKQQAWLDGLRECGQDAFVWRPIDLDSGAIRRALR